MKKLWQKLMCLLFGHEFCYRTILYPDMPEIYCGRCGKIFKEKP